LAYFATAGLPVYISVGGRGEICLWAQFFKVNLPQPCSSCTSSTAWRSYSIYRYCY